jgi:hypothetical protein
MIDKRIIEAWRLRSTKAVDDDGKTLPPPLGPTPNGVMCFQANGCRSYSGSASPNVHSARRGGAGGSRWILLRRRSRMLVLHGFWI